MHWADVIALKLKEIEGPHRIATGITPSGHIHVGNMREILTGDIVHRACQDASVDSTLYYLADDFDPLRKVYPFLPEEYKDHIGKPLSEIPSPGDGGGTYAQYFLKPFLNSVKELGIEAEVLPSSISYKEGKYYEPTRILLENVSEVKNILETVSRRELPDDWMPYNAKCPSCGRIDSTKALNFEDPFVEFKCSCGHHGKADARTDDGKLPWRLDWPARWSWLGVTCEPFGKDHAAAGGSYDTSSRIIREILGREPPNPVVYEWIQLKGKGAMSSSSGVVVSGVDMLKMTPPEVLRFLIARNQPSRHIDMDPGLGILNLVDDFDRFEKEYAQGEAELEEKGDRRRAFEFSMVDKDYLRDIGNITQVPYRHLVTLVQLSDGFDNLKDMVLRTEGLEEMGGNSLRRLQDRTSSVKFWLDNYAPEGVRFTLYDEPPKEEIENLTDELKAALQAMREDFSEIEWNAENIHNTIYEGSRSRDISPKSTFKAFYRILLGRDRGPRLGFFLSTMEKDDVLAKLDIALQNS